MNKIKQMMYKKDKAGYLLALPGLLMLIVFVIIPFVMAIYFSFTNRTFIPNPKLGTEFVGLNNYTTLLKDPVFWKALGNNIYFTVIAVPIQVGLALLLAILVNKKLRGIKFFRTVFFSPVVIPMLIVSITWSLFFTPTENGIINSIIHFVTFGQVDVIKWLYDPSTAMISIIILSVWQGVGFQMIIILSGLQAIPEELYESASMDGANKWQQFIHVTMPMLRNNLVFVVTSSIIMSFKLVTQVLVLTQGGPLNSTQTLVYLIYQSGYIDQMIGYASAIAVVFFVIVFVFSLVQQRLTKMVEN